jgi:hypothetical protein
MREHVKHNNKIIGTVSHDEDHGESRTDITVLLGPLTDDEVRAHMDYPDGKDCNCPICNMGADCCGNWFAYPITIERSENYVIVKQTWCVNV